MSRKLELLSRFNVGGVAIRALWDQGNDPRLWDLVRDYQASAQASVAPVGSTFSVAGSWRASGARSDEITGLDQQDYTWTAPEQPGEYEIGVSILANDGQTVAGSQRVAVLVTTPTATPTPTPTPTPILQTHPRRRQRPNPRPRLNLRPGPGPDLLPQTKATRRRRVTYPPIRTLAMAFRPTWCKMTRPESS